MPGRFEPAQPIRSDLPQTPLVKAIHPFAAAFLHPHEACPVEDAQVTRGRRPRAVETVSDFPRSHLAPVEFEDKQDLPAGCVSQRVEYKVNLRELSLRDLGTQGNETF